jgi:hypothetical protein
MNARLTDQDRAELARILRDVIEADRYPFSREGEAMEGIAVEA